jgi:hypothetical protein
VAAEKSGRSASVSDRRRRGSWVFVEAVSNHIHYGTPFATHVFNVCALSLLSLCDIAGSVLDHERIGAKSQATAFDHNGSID